MAVAEVVPLADSMTLYELEESLSLLIESAEEQEELTPELKAAIEQYAAGAAEKRDRMAPFAGMHRFAFSWLISGFSGLLL